ncbi:MAG: plastocyanin/azurin family copper-binding protein [Chloroflexota bacterium]
MKKLFLNTATVLILAAAVFLSACGGGAEPEAVAEEPAGVTLVFEGQDIAYDITSATVQSGQEVTVELNNVGALEHSWVLISDRVDPLEATEEDALLGANSGVVAGGDKSSFTFFAPAPGTYKFVCAVEGHVAAGMVGDLIVE